MSRNKHHVIVYCADNQQIAKQLSADLQLSGFKIQQKEISEQQDQPMLRAVDRPEGAILMLITDNFLKSGGCMRGALEALKEWATSGILVPIVADGRKKTADGWETIPTAFDRVSNIIQYMNYWQDRYLELRKEIRHHEEDQNLEHQLELTKSISTEAGEFLRYLRNLNWYSLDDFKSGNFRIFRKFYGETLPSDASENQGAEETPDTPRQKSLTELIQDSSEELMAENMELSNKSSAPVQEENPPVDLAEIPGMDLLNDGARQTGTEGTASEDEDDDDVTSILNEVLGEEDDEGEEYQFVGEDPDDPGEFDLDSLFEDEAAITGSPGGEEESVEDENEVMLDLVSDDEEGLVLKGDGKGHATPEEVLEHAVDLFDDGEIEEGLDFLKKTVQLNPNDNTMRYYYAYALARYGEKWKAARQQLDIILVNDEEHPDAWFLLAEVTEQQEKFTEARQYFEKVASLQPDYPEVFYRLGLLTIQHFPEQDAKAAGYFKKAISHNPKNTEAYYLLGTLLNERLGDPESAAGYFKTTLEHDPSHPFANYDLALLYYQSGEKEQASVYYERATAVNPELKTPQNDAAFFIEKTESEVLTEDHEAEENIDTQQPETTPEPPAGIAAGETTEPAGTSSPHLNGKASGAETSQEVETMNAGEIAETAEIAVAVAAIASELDFFKTPEPAVEEKLAGPEMEVAVAIEPEVTPGNDLPIVLITGATAGIGRATAEVFAANGFRVIATGRRQDRLDEMKDDFIEKYRNEIQVLSFDVRNSEEVKAAVENLPEAWRNVDILINNAGLSRGLAPIHEGDLEHWDTMIDTNIKGLLYMTRAIAPQMVERRSGHIINVSSGAGKEVYPGGNVYCATKSAVETLTKSMRLDLFKHNVRVSQVAPGHVEETEFARVRFDGDGERAAQVYENFQPLKSSDVAEAIFFIATRPPHVNIQDVLMFGTQQAGSNFIERSGR
jgi:NADP-dependent 3-hydroxy acid dehydrogenase YdfG/tetratricopeptide (TPR) repeat protein